MERMILVKVNRRKIKLLLMIRPIGPYRSFLRLPLIRRKRKGKRGKWRRSKKRRTRRKSKRIRKGKRVRTVLKTEEN